MDLIFANKKVKIGVGAHGKAALTIGGQIKIY